MDADGHGFLKQESGSRESEVVRDSESGPSVVTSTPALPPPYVGAYWQWVVFGGRAAVPRRRRSSSSALPGLVSNFRSTDPRLVTSAPIGIQRRSSSSALPPSHPGACWER